MTLSKLKLEKLEAKVSKKLNKQTESVLQVPDNWADFARLTKIRSGGNVVNFDPYNYQVELVNLMLDRSICVVKSRQLGISETITCFMLWRACLNPGYLGLVFSKTQTDSSLLARRMKRMIESIGLKTTTENLSDIEIQGYGRILFRNSKPESARGIESVVDCFFDELAFLETGKEVYDALAPAQQMVGDKARVFVVSTPNGKAGFYWDLLSSGNGTIDVEMLCKQVSKGESKPFQHWTDSGGWSKVLIHWLEHPKYGSNPNFLQDVHEKQKLSWTTINQEYNLSFQESETNVFTSDLVRLCAKGVSEYPIENTFYFIGVDAATTGDDYAVATVLKFEKDVFSVATFYRKRQQSTEYHLYHISKLLNEYKPIMVGIEVTGGVGQVWLETLSKNHAFTKFQSIRTTGDSKPAMLNRLQLLMEQEKFIYPENSLIVDELLNFKRNDKKLEAASGKHDGIIMSSCFALAAAEIWGY
jgi:Terminase RNaseH-like domain